MTLPLLYTFRRCPYAIRARLAVHASGVPVEMREVDLKHKPPDMLALSPKGTVPVLRLPDGKVIDESLDVMHWALSVNDPEGWLDLGAEARADADALIARNDGPFKQQLDRYKYPNRASSRLPDGTNPPAAQHRDEAGGILADLDARLSRDTWLLGARFSIADAALAPFVRQFAMVDPAWFSATPWTSLRRWLDTTLVSARFAAVMQKPRT
jgi:glutathione S-transferase